MEENKDKALVSWWDNFWPVALAVSVGLSIVVIFWVIAPLWLSIAFSCGYVSSLVFLAVESIYKPPRENPFTRLKTYLHDMAKEYGWPVSCFMVSISGLWLPLVMLFVLVVRVGKRTFGGGK